MAGKLHSSSLPPYGERCKYFQLAWRNVDLCVRYRKFTPVQGCNSRNIKNCCLCVLNDCKMKWLLMTNPRIKDHANDATTAENGGGVWGWHHHVLQAQLSDNPDRGWSWSSNGQKRHKRISTRRRTMRRRSCSGERTLLRRTPCRYERIE